MLRELQTFLAVVRHGTFANAAAHIGLTQSAVSAQIQRLEQELGFALFDRTGRAAVLNADGRETLAVAEELMTVYARLGRHAGSPRSGLVRIGAIASVHVSFLADALASFRHEMPGYRVKLVPGVSLNLLGQVDSGEIDIAVMIKPPFALPSDLQWRSLLAEPFVLLAPRAHGKRPWRELLESEPFIRYDRGSFGGRVVDQFLRRARIPVRDAIELDELQGIAQLVQRGLGVALVPITGTSPWPKGVVPLSLGDDTFHREIGLVERPQHSRQAAATLLAQRIAQAAQSMARAPS
ncbi:LysR family transcriptional regulator [Cupriavidus sp. AcVe19-1a]|uniref:LysR family transcriptional regulator n=1 Tax=Cupriavidus sp. AcVe19-1a TaxID=2821359 RepID=UPI001AE37202|nr:LysR family transcriptional regulator [Cupriavidus sp. AcVe19-1a]MBP0628520.1 LysR family transcriptional regulator [Cupriavidus sp. AcVe19-1a]